MHVSGITFIKNGLSLGYPFIESIASLEPLCDEVIINIGFEDQELTKDDGTFQLIRQTYTHPKFKIIKSYWDSSIDSGGLILSQFTNTALASAKGDICLYLQGDEIFHEEDYSLIQDDLLKLHNSPRLEGIVFHYHHFYGNTDIIRHTRTSYRAEVRAIKNNRHIQSWKDAQGFRNSEGKKIICFHSEGRVFHYGWARSAPLMDKKVKIFSKLYHGKSFEDQDFHYQRVWGLKKFKGTHPQVVKKWAIENHNSIDLLAFPLKFEFKNLRLMLSDLVEALTGYRIAEYKNYIIR